MSWSYHYKEVNFHANYSESRLSSLECGGGRGRYWRRPVELKSKPKNIIVTTSTFLFRLLNYVPDTSASRISLAIS